MVGLSLHRASVYFDRDPLYDAYTANFLYNGQAASFDASQPDGTFQKRRSISLAPSLTLPSRRAVDLYGQIWILGDATQDGWNYSVVRQNLGARVATDSFRICTPQAFITDAWDEANNWDDDDWIHATMPEPLKAYGQAEYYRDNWDRKTSSERDMEFSIHLAKTENTQTGYLLVGDSGTYFVVESFISPEGFNLNRAIRLRDPLTGLATEGFKVTATTYGAFDPVNETRQKGDEYPGLLIKRYLLYYHKVTTANTHESGDISLLISGDISTPPSATDVLKIGGADWMIETVQKYLDAWLLHIRKQ